MRAPPTPSSWTHRCRLPSTVRAATSRRRGPGVLGGVGERLGDDVVGRDLDLLRQAAPEVDGQLDGYGRTAGQRLDRRRQAAFGQDSGVDAAGGLPELVQRGGQTLRHPAEPGPQPGQVVGRRRSVAQVEHQRHQPLLRAVVQVALDPPAFAVAGGDDPGPGGGQLLAVLAQRAGHRVEAVCQRPDLVSAAFRHPGTQVPAGEPARHGRRPADRSNDALRQVAREQDDERHRPDQAADARERRMPTGGARGAPRGRRETPFRGHEGREVGAQRVDPALALLAGRADLRRRRRPPGDVDHRDRVVADVRRAGAVDRFGTYALFGAVGDESLQRRGLLREGQPGGRPRLEERLLPGDQESPFRGLDIQDDALERVGGDQHVGGPQGAPIRLAQFGERGDQDGERAADEQREQAAGEDGATGQATAHDRPPNGRCRGRGVRLFGRNG